MYEITISLIYRLNTFNMHPIGFMGTFIYTEYLTNMQNNFRIHSTSANKGNRLYKDQKLFDFKLQTAKYFA